MSAQGQFASTALTAHPPATLPSRTPRVRNEPSPISGHFQQPDLRLKLESRSKRQNARRQGPVENSGRSRIIHIPVGIPVDRRVDAVELRAVQKVVRLH